MTKRLAEVAKKAGVSEATVSRVLNGRSGVSEATRASVLTALDVMGYERPSKLRGARARLVGLVLPELQNPIFPALAEIVSGGLTQNGYTPLLCTQNSGGITESDYVDLMLAQQVSGVIFVGGNYTETDAPHEHYDRLRKVNLPTVLVSAPVPGIDFATISTDDASAAEQAVSHLHQLGHRRIGMLLGPTGHIPSQRKRDGAERVLTRLGSPLDPGLVVNGLYSIESGQAGASRLIAAGATGIVCASDLLALGAVRAARRLGLNVPTDISVVGFDDSILMSFTEPPLTTVRQPIDAMGRTVIDLLLGQIAGTMSAGDELLFEPELVLRGSTGPAPVSA